MHTLEWTDTDGDRVRLMEEKDCGPEIVGVMEVQPRHTNDRGGAVFVTRENATQLIAWLASKL